MMKNVIRISEEHKDVTCENCGWSWDIEPEDKHPYLCHQCGHENTKHETDEGAGPYDAPSFQMKPDHVHFKHQYNEQNIHSKYLLQMGRKSILLEQYGDEAELFKLASAYYRKNGKVMTIKVLEKILHTLSKRDEPHRAKSQEFPPSLHLQEQKGGNEKVRAIQKRLISLGYNLGKTGADGFWGALTDKAWKTWKSKQSSTKKTNFEIEPTRILPKQYGPKNLNRIEAQPTDYLGTQGTVGQQQILGQNLLNQIKSGKLKKTSNMPLHVRMLYDYLAGRTTPMTISDLTDAERKFLRQAIISASSKREGFSYPGWDKIGASGPTALTSAGREKEKLSGKDKSMLDLAFKMNLPSQFKYTLGSVAPTNVKYDKNNDVAFVKDNYDYNNVENNTSKEQVIKDFFTSIKDLVKGTGTTYGAIRHAVGLKELGGYNGFPVNIQIPNIS
jgi:peptidoglycan hydrolase-like protein with peptidoglycan-binding domain